MKGKRPVPAGATGQRGIVTRENIQSWSNDPEWATQNLALRHDGTISLDADDYASKHGAAELAQLEMTIGPLPATITSTARGAETGSRQHFYRLPAELDRATSFVRQASESVDVVQRTHRYSVVYPSVNPEADNAQYLWYDYDGQPLVDADGNPAIPSVSDLEELPWAWVEYLAKKAVNRPGTSEQWHGEIPEDATQEERRKLSTIIDSLTALPEVWAPGTGWHDTVFRAAAWLSRIVNSNAYALDVNSARALLLEHTPTYPEWGPEKILEQWESAVTSTAGQYEEPPLASRPALLPALTVLNRLSPLLWDLFYAELPQATAAAGLEARRRLMFTVLKEGGDSTFAASVAWYAKHAGAGLRDDTKLGEARLWREFDQVAVETGYVGEDDEDLPIFDTANGVDRTADIAKLEPLRRDEGVGEDVEATARLLTDDERKAVRYSDEFRWWGTRYLDWARTRVGLWNEPYHRINRWLILSLIFSQYAYVPRKKGPMYLNLFGFVLGPSTTGKTESMDIMRPVWRAFFVADDPDIGGDATPNALIEKLVERDMKPSFFNKDEAHGMFREVASASWLAGLIERFTALYECRVPMMQRAMKKDVSGKNATSFFTMHLMGVEDELIEVLNEDMWKSGFLARFVWAVGESIEVRPEDIEFDEVDGDAAQIAAAYDAMPRQWAAEFNATIRKAGFSPETPFPVRYEAAAKERHLQVMRRLAGIYAGHKLEHMLKPTLIRFAENIRKCATLVAVSEGATMVSLRHELIALEQAEEWLANVLRLARQTTATAFARDMDRIETLVAADRRGIVRREQVYRHMSPKLTKWETDKVIDNLVAQGRVEELGNRDGRFIAIRQEGEQAA